MKHARYIGPRADVRFCGALVRPDPKSRRHVLAQFDRQRTADGVKALEHMPLCHGWHRFKRSEFRMDRARSEAHYRSTRKERETYWAKWRERNASKLERLHQYIASKTVLVGHGPECNCMTCLPEPHSMDQIRAAQWRR